MSQTTDPAGTVLITGATGCIGGLLLRRLEATECRLRCLTRRPGVLAAVAAPSTEVVQGDLIEGPSLQPAMAGVRTAYYLVHSMGGAADFPELDRLAAENFARAARAAGVGRIVYLGGLGSGDDLSTHLASRHEVGRVLRSSGVTTLELRASIVIGSGSASFETVRTLVEHLPAIPAPVEVETAAQPIAVDDVVEYLLAALTIELRASAVIEIGGGDQVTYGDVMREYARQRKLRRRVIPMPRLASQASRALLGPLVPVHGRIAAAMVDSLRNETVVRSSAASEVFSIRPRGLTEAIERALAGEDREVAETRWSRALDPEPAPRWGGIRFGRRMVSSRVVRVSAHADEAFAPIRRIGGPTGWYAGDWFWRARGALDRIRGGTGMRRGRRDPEDLDVGDVVDFWRVERLEPGRRLLLAAEMKMPGRLWLQFDIDDEDGVTAIRQTTVFDPAGYIGLMYWYILYPAHQRIFGAMLGGLRRTIDSGPRVFAISTR